MFRQQGKLVYLYRVPDMWVQPSGIFGALRDPVVRPVSAWTITPAGAALLPSENIPDNVNAMVNATQTRAQPGQPMRVAEWSIKKLVELYDEGSSGFPRLLIELDEHNQLVGIVDVMVPLDRHLRETGTDRTAYARTVLQRLWGSLTPPPVDSLGTPPETGFVSTPIASPY
jgi:hypothetical protein